MKSKGFWRWCGIICNSAFLDIVHRLYFNKITTFWKLDLLLSSGKKGRTETQSVGPPGWASLRPGELGWSCPNLRLAKPENGRIQLPKRINFIKILTMDNVQKNAITAYLSYLAVSYWMYSFTVVIYHGNIKPNELCYVIIREISVWTQLNMAIRVSSVSWLLSNAYRETVYMAGSRLCFDGRASAHCIA
jgi:hypothetical protein